MSNSLEAKALRQPFRFGLMLGALALPLGWTVSLSALNVLQSRPLLNSEQITLLFALGFLPGMILGAGAVRAWAAWQNGNRGEVRWHLIGHGAFVAALCAPIWLMVLWSSYLNWPAKGWIWALRRDADAFCSNFPLQCALLMLLLGLFLRSPRA